MMEQFKKDVEIGLNALKKSLPSKYFYDEKGDQLFTEIMHLPEYYVTRSELEIFRDQTFNIIETLQLKSDSYFELIELGAGDGLKTKELLKLLHSQNYKFDYCPIDISQNALDKLEKSIYSDLPNIRVNAIQGDYFKILGSLKKGLHPKVVMFLGSSLGNMPDHVATLFISELAANLSANDKVLLGLDLIKSDSIVLPAYNDNKGVTAAFNFNLLQRINKELGGNFDINNFEHRPEYCEAEGVAKSFLVSKIEQEVYIKELESTFEFEKNEKILTEISRKYNDTIVNKILENTGLEITAKLSDGNNYFTEYVLERVDRAVCNEKNRFSINGSKVLSEVKN